VLVLLRAAAALGGADRASRAGSRFVEAMQQRAVEACRDFEPGGIVALMSALSELGEVGPLNPQPEPDTLNPQPSTLNP